MIRSPFSLRTSASVPFQSRLFAIWRHAWRAWASSSAARAGAAEVSTIAPNAATRAAAPVSLVWDFVMASSSAPASAPTTAGGRRQQINAGGPRTLPVGGPFRSALSAGRLGRMLIGSLSIDPTARAAPRGAAFLVSGGLVVLPPLLAPQQRLARAAEPRQPLLDDAQQGARRPAVP